MHQAIYIFTMIYKINEVTIATLDSIYMKNNYAKSKLVENTYWMDRLKIVKKLLFKKLSKKIGEIKFVKYDSKSQNIEVFKILIDNLMLKDGSIGLLKIFRLVIDRNNFKF